MTIVWYLFIAIWLQSGEPTLTYSFPSLTKADCLDLKMSADADLTDEVNTPDPDNAAIFKTFCQPVDMGDTSKVKHVPAKDET